jgi:hypothetical protein
MKVTLANGTVLEMDDAPTPKPETKDAPAPSTTTAPAKPKQADAVTRKPPAAKTEPKVARPTREAVPPAPSAQAQPPASEEQPTQPVSNPLHSFDLQGGVHDILDPGRGKPNIYQFVKPKGEA